MRKSFSALTSALEQGANLARASIESVDKKYSISEGVSNKLAQIDQKYEVRGRLAHVAATFRDEI
jgi:hypothetical protein